MTDFKPTHYMRLIERHSRINCGIVEYHLTDIGIEDPNCTIIPMMVSYDNNHAIIQVGDRLINVKFLRWGVKDNIAILHYRL